MGFSFRYVLASVFDFAFLITRDNALIDRLHQFAQVIELLQMHSFCLKGSVGWNAPILETIAGMTVMDVVDLITAMEEKFGVTAAVAAAPVAAAAAAAPVEEKTEFDVVMSSFKNAIQYDKKWAKAWHWWALANFELASYLDGKKRQQGHTGFSI